MECYSISTALLVNAKDNLLGGKVSMFWIIVISNTNIHLNILKPGQSDQVRKNPKGLHQNPKRKAKQTQSEAKANYGNGTSILHGEEFAMKGPEDAIQRKSEKDN